MNGKVVQTVTMDDKVISKQSDSEQCRLLQDKSITNFVFSSRCFTSISLLQQRMLYRLRRLWYTGWLRYAYELVNYLAVLANLTSDITNLTVTLSEADTNFANVMSLDSVTDSTFKSTDGGITWQTDRITVSSIDFDSSSDTEVN